MINPGDSINQPQPTVVYRDLEGGKHEVAVDQLSFRPSVYGVAIQGGKVLLSRQWDGYDLPGGGIELGETIAGALVREVREETGLIVKQGPVLAAEHDFFKLSGYEQYVSCILLFYACTVVGGTLGDTDFDVDEVDTLHPPEWVALERVPGLKFFNPVDSPALIAHAAAL